MVSKYSKIEIQDKSKTKTMLRSRLGDPFATGLVFTSRDTDTDTKTREE